MNSTYRLTAIAAVLIIGLAAAQAGEQQSADTNDDISVSTPRIMKEFKDNSPGTILVSVVHKSIGEEKYTVQVIARENGAEIAHSETSNLTADKPQVEIEVSMKLSSGYHDIEIVVQYKTDDTGWSEISNTVTVKSEKTLWSGWLPYIVIIIVALIVVLMIFVWYRGRPKSQPAVTFNDLEEGKTAEPAPVASASKKKYSAETPESSGPVKYKSFRRK